MAAAACKGLRKLIRKDTVMRLRRLRRKRFFLMPTCMVIRKDKAKRMPKPNLKPMPMAGLSKLT